MSDERAEMVGLLHHIAAEGERIEREKCGKALTDDEVRKVKTANFVRSIAPYLFKDVPR